MRKSISLKAVLTLGENTGDTSGSPTFQGGPWGMGKQHQLAVNNPSKNLVDPQEEEEKHIYGSLDGDFDDRPHMQPIPDDIRSMEERSESDALYRDLPGYPRMNTLVAPQDFMPKGLTGEPKRDTENMRLSLTPPGNGEKEEWFGVGPFDGSSEETEPLIKRRELSEDLMDIGSNTSINNWKTTTMANRGKKIEAKYNVLVKPVNHLDDSDDIETRVGGMGNLVAPKKYAPDGNAPIEEALDSERDDEGWDVLDILRPHAAEQKKHTVTGPTPAGDKDLGSALKEMVDAAIEDAFKSQAQRRMFYARAKDSPKWKKLTHEFERETPKGKKLPNKVTEDDNEESRGKHDYDKQDRADALGGKDGFLYDRRLQMEKELAEASRKR